MGECPAVRALRRPLGGRRFFIRVRVMVARGRGMKSVAGRDGVGDFLGKQTVA